MGLLGMVKDLVSTVGDAAHMGGEIEKIEHALDQLLASGKCPEEVAGALKKFEEVEAKAKSGEHTLSPQESLSHMSDFAKVLEANKEKLPEEILALVSKFEGQFGKLSELAGKFIK